VKRAIYTFLIACGPAQEPVHTVAPLPEQRDAGVEARDAVARDVELRDVELRDTSASTSTIGGAEAIIAKMRVGLKRCYTAALKSDPNLRASIKLTIDVAPDGSVTKVTPHSTPPVPNDLEQCLALAVSKGAFEPPGGNGAVFELPINLVPANP